MAQSLPLDRIATLTGATSTESIESIQSLWSGYGEIVRVRLSGGTVGDGQTVIVKHVCPPSQRNHKYGWSGDVSHQRKLDSYANETNWYRHGSSLCGNACRVPHLVAAESVAAKGGNPSWLLILEDLDAAGFDRRHRRANDTHVDACLKWLANFHAAFLFDTKHVSQPPAFQQHDLWPIGTYWHLATRPDELATMEDGPLKHAATAIDTALNAARFQTLVHGDAKLANFCFAEDDQVAAVDFQYVGGGCGIKDVAYFISSCFSDDECERHEQELLDAYFTHLRHAIPARKQNDAIDLQALETEWRSLYAFAWADFYRFLAGWSPGHWKMHRYSHRLTERVIRMLPK